MLARVHNGMLYIYIYMPLPFVELDDGNDFSGWERENRADTFRKLSGLKVGDEWGGNTGSNASETIQRMNE